MTTLDGSLSLAPIPAAQVSASVPRTLITPRLAPAVERRLQWQRRYVARLRITDTVVVLASTMLAAWVQIAGIARVELAEAPWDYGRVALATIAIWLVMLMLFHTRDKRVLGHGTVEYRRVAHATGMAFGILAIGFVIFQSQGMRTQLLIALPAGTVGLVLGRWLCRQWLVRQRQLGEYISRAIVVGRREDVEYVVNAVTKHDLVGYHVVGVTLEDDASDAVEIGGRTLRAVGRPDQAQVVAAQLGADAVIVASTPDGDSTFVKRLAWQLEGTAAELVLSSPLADVAGPRMTLKPVEGLPLIQVEIPTFEGGRYLLKRAMDILVATLALLLVAIVTPFVAIAIKLDTRGPVFFRQRRVGRDGREFWMVKFRSMRSEAEHERHALQELNAGAGPMFKMKDDPRVTRVGRFLRRTSIDELPQFWNVLIGDMSVVGPRPPLTDEVTAYDGKVYRRLYIKPGITGLWQVSGRSDLSWEESVRLDLRYVENWSLMSDLVIMWRTAVVMVKPHGAY